MRKFLFLITLFSTCIGLATAQSPVKGSVKDNTGEPIIGASVVEKGTTNGVATDISGEFTITVKAGATLQISYLGYVKQEVPVPARSTLIEVTLLEDYTTLDEVVVVGYGTQKKATLVGAVSSVSNKDISVTKNENVVNMLTGKLPGVRISQLSSRPGEFATKIDIRGMGTPLVVVDGITRDIGYFSRMDANEIESISVLKDASAAIYGLRSANGVLLVTTKRGDQEGKFDVTYSTNYGWQQFLYLPDNVDALDYMTLRNEKKWRDFGSNYMNRQLPDYNDADRAPFLNGTQQTTDWMSALFHDVTPQYQHNVSIDGSTDKVNYFFNLGYLNQSGALKTDAMNYNRWNFRSNIDVKLTNRLKAEISFGGYMDEMNEPAMDIWTVYKSAWLQRPYVPIYANGNPEYLNSYEVQDDNPLALTDPNIAGYRNNVARVFNSSLALSYKIPFIEGLTARAMYSYNYNYQENSNFSKFFYLYRYYPDTDYYEPSARHGSSGDNGIYNSVSKYAYPGFKRLMNLRLDYRHAFGSHNVNAMVGFEEEYSYSENFYASRHTSLDISYLFAGLDNDKQKGSGGSPSDRASQAFIGRFAYDYQGKYMAEFTFRYDGSSRFPKESRWGFFPTGLVGWRISEESFIKENLSMVNNLKLRASYGIMGDDSSAGNYPPNIVGYNLAPSSLGWLFNGAYYGGVNPTAIPNLELTWYTSKMMNLGVDVETYNGLLGGSVEYFVRNREGLLASSGTVLPGTVGADMPQKNLDSDRVFGYEITLSHRNKIGDVRYFANAQMGTTRHMFLDRTATKAGNSYDHWRNRYENRYDNIWWGTEYGGQYQSDEQIYNFPRSAGSSTLPGDYYYKDWNGDGVVNGNDSHPIALTGMPWINYGFSLGAEWKGIDINANFQGSALVYVKYAEALVEPLSFGGAGTMSKFLDRWHPEDPNADYWDPRTVWIKGEYPITGSGLADGTKAIEDASYLRLKTLELGYNLPKKYLNILGVKGLRVYVSGYNVLTFTGLKHTDPEHPGSEGGASNEYVDTYKYPINQSINVGASIKF